MNKEEINRIRENVNMRCLMLEATGSSYNEVKNECTLLMYIDELEEKLDKIKNETNKFMQENDKPKLTEESYDLCITIQEIINKEE